MTPLPSSSTLQNYKLHQASKCSADNKARSNARLVRIFPWNRLGAPRSGPHKWWLVREAWSFERTPVLEDHM